MGKNHRHKKNLRTEKSKTKLKAKPAAKTKFLPKGANVTNVDFKIKPIVLPEQLRSNTDDEPLTKRKLNFKDLLTRLNHRNVNAKYEACGGLLELIKITPDYDLETRLYTLLHEVCKLFLEKDSGRVRRRSIKVVSDLMEKVHPLKLTWFFDILTSYLSCAITELNRNVQEDSLLVIDAYLNHAPLLFVQSFDKIFTNFVTLISKLRFDNKLGSSRALTVNLGRKITSTNWRMKVLNRLHRILQVIVDKNKYPGENPKSSVVVDENTSVIPIYKGGYFLNKSSTVQDSGKIKVQEYVEILIPLLHETWAETVSADSGDNIDNGFTIISQDAASILTSVTGIFHLLWKLLNNADGTNQSELKTMFLTKDAQIFFDYLLNQFPYRQRDWEKSTHSKKDKMLFELNLDSKCIQENLLITYMFCTLNKTLPSLQHTKKAQQIINYLKMCMGNRNYIKSENIEMLSATLRVIFFNNSQLWAQKGLNIEMLLDCVVSFNDGSLLNSHKMHIFSLLCDIVGLIHLRSQKYQLWLSSLPSLLCNATIPVHVIDTLSVLSRQNDSLFLEALLNQLPKILHNLSLMDGTEALAASDYVKIINMFYYLPMTKENLAVLEKFGKIQQQTRISNCVQGVLQEKYRNMINNDNLLTC